MRLHLWPVPIMLCVALSIISHYEPRETRLTPAFSDQQSVNLDTNSSGYNPRSDAQLCREVAAEVSQADLPSADKERIIERCWAWAGRSGKLYLRAV